MEDLARTIQQAQKGDDESVSRLIDAYSGLIYKECEQFGLWGMPDWSHADLHQEVLFRLFAKIDMFDPQPNSESLRPRFESWIRSTLKNQVKNILRGQKAIKRKPKNGIKGGYDPEKHGQGKNKGSRTPSSIFVQGEEHEKVNQAIKEKLDERAQSVLKMRVVDDLSLKEIAERLGMTFDQVRYSLTKSMDALKKHLSD